MGENPAKTVHWHAQQVVLFNRDFTKATLGAMIVGVYLLVASLAVIMIVTAVLVARR